MAGRGRDSLPAGPPAPPEPGRRPSGSSFRVARPLGTPGPAESARRGIANRWGTLAFPMSVGGPPPRRERAVAEGAAPAGWGGAGGMASVQRIRSRANDPRVREWLVDR